MASGSKEVAIIPLIYILAALFIPVSDKRHGEPQRTKNGVKYRTI